MSEVIRNRKVGQTKVRWPGVFDVVKELGCSLPNVEATTRYDGAPVLKAHGVFKAGLAMHASAEPDTLVVRAEFEEREGLLEDAPDTYYYRRYPVVLVRLSLLNCDVLRELLTGSWRMTVENRRKRPGNANDNAVCDTTWRNRSSLTPKGLVIRLLLRIPIAQPITTEPVLVCAAALVHR